MEVQYASQHIIEEKILDMMSEIPLNWKDQVSPMPGSAFDRFIQRIGYWFQTDNCKVT